MDIIKKHKNQIEYNEDNEFIDDQVFIGYSLALGIWHFLLSN